MLCINTTNNVIIDIQLFTKRRKGRLLAIEAGQCNLIVIDPGMLFS